MAKLSKAQALYMPPSMASSKKGFSCSGCMMFIKDTGQCVIVNPAKVSGEKGVCGLYVHGTATTSEHHKPMRLISAEMAGYTEQGPTHCDSCEYFNDRNMCSEVEGLIEPNGCCNVWEKE